MRKLILVVVLLGGCSRVPLIPGLTPYKIDIQQGNYITQEMVAKLKPGMSRGQVRFALGTPLIVDPFHTDRWDYIYVLNKKGKLVEHRRIIAVFQGDSLVRIEGDVVPGNPAETDKTAAAAKPENPKPVAAGSTEGAVATPLEGAAAKSAETPSPGAAARPEGTVAAQPEGVPAAPTQ